MPRHNRSREERAPKKLTGASVYDKTPMHKLIFEMEITFCERFPGLDPFKIRKQRARDFFRIAANLTEYDRKRSKNKGKNKQKRIRKPASDNSGWW